MTAMSKRSLLAASAVALAAAVADSPGLVNGYVWDDPDVVLGVYDGAAPRPWTELLLAPDANASDPRTPYYRPLTRLSFTLDRALWGEAPAPRHAENLALHAATAVLALLVLRRLVDARVALVAALIFAVHPLEAEAVNELANRNAVLAAALGLAALLAHVSWKERGGWWRGSTSLDARRNCSAMSRCGPGPMSSAIGLPAAIPKAKQALMTPLRTAMKKPLRKSNSLMEAFFSASVRRFSLAIPAAPATAMPMRLTRTPPRMTSPDVEWSRPPNWPR